MARVLKSVEHCARKANICDGCKGPIDPGVRYKYQFIVDGGDAWHWREHLHCRRASEIVASEMYHWDLIDGGMPVVSDMCEEEILHVKLEDPEAARQIWPQTA